MGFSFYVGLYDMDLKEISKKVSQELFRRTVIEQASSHAFDLPNRPSSLTKAERTRLGFIFCTYLDGKKIDTACVAFFNSKMKFIGIFTLDVPCNHIYDMIDSHAFYFKAKYFAIAHTHIGYSVDPSFEDLNTTSITRLRYHDLIFLDHFIVSDCDYISLINNERHPYETRKDLSGK